MSIFIIEKLWIDKLENIRGDAIGYTIVGYADTEERAKSIVGLGGVTVGTGWPIEKDEEKPNLRYEEVKEYNPQ